MAPVPPLEDHAAIGDGRSAALVTSAGVVDWLCWPRFDSPALFSALLDPERGGAFVLRPAVPFRSTRRYVPETNVLRTRFETAGGTLELTDLMPVSSEEAKRSRLTPEHELLRVLEGIAGEVPLELCFDPRPDFGRGRLRIRDGGAAGLRVETRDGVYLLRGDVRVAPSARGVAETQVLVRAGDTLRFSLSLATELPAVRVPLGDRVREAVEVSLAWWRAWAARCRYEGPHRDVVVRSALALKLLGYAPSGAIVAAPTTSLPERVGADLNWDYRYCWLRDAAFTARALYGLGYAEEATAYVSWLLHATRLTLPALRALYDVYGRAPPAERELAHLTGWRGSRPVRTGNAARDQVQLDVYGEVIDAVAVACRAGATLDRETRALLRDLGTYVCRHWARPDHGLWEPRVAPRHHTHSRVLCWTALDRLIGLAEAGLLPGPVDGFRADRERIRAEVQTRGWNAVHGSYTSELDGTEVDAALLQLGWYGFEAPGAPRMRGTYARIVRELGAGRGLVRRYRMPEGEAEGAFGICSFWAVEHLARGGASLDEARRAFEALLVFANDVGLFAEEIDPVTGAALGNFPQAFTHVGLINAAISLEERARRRAGPEAPRPSAQVRAP